MIVNNFVFIHIPKTGGQSIEAYLKSGVSGTHKDFQLGPNSLERVGPPRLAHMTLSEYQKHHADKLSGKVFFCILRSVQDRFISEMNFRGFGPAAADRHLRNTQLGYIVDDYRTYEDELRHMMPQKKFLENAAGLCQKVFCIRYDTFFSDPKGFLEKLNIYRSANFPYIRPSAVPIIKRLRPGREGLSRLPEITKHRLNDFYGQDSLLYEALPESGWGTFCVENHGYFS